MSSDDFHVCGAGIDTPVCMASCAVHSDGALIRFAGASSVALNQSGADSVFCRDYIVTLT